MLHSPRRNKQKKSRAQKISNIANPADFDKKKTAA